MSRITLLDMLMNNINIFLNAQFWIYHLILIITQFDNKIKYLMFNT